MRPNCLSRLSLLLFLALLHISAAVVDRVAVVIGKTVITEGEVQDDLRLTEFIDDQALDLGATARRAAAEHLVDQELIRREMEIGGYSPAAAAEGDQLLLKFRQDRFHSLSDYRAALRKYGITEDQLKRRLVWQLTAIRFTDFRFKAEQPAGTANNTVDQQMDAWLKQARADAKISFKQEAFQ